MKLKVIAPVLAAGLGLGSWMVGCGDSDPEQQPSPDGSGGSSGVSSSGATQTSSSGAVPEDANVNANTTLLSGSVLGPAGTPMPNVYVSWSETPPPALDASASCASCSAPPATQSTLSGAAGFFQLRVPTDREIYLITQRGRFRRVRSLRLTAADSTLAADVTTLPQRTDAAAGDSAPRIGLVPGPYDKIERPLAALGVQVEPLAATDLTDLSKLLPYQMVLVPSRGSCADHDDPAQQDVLRRYVSAGGVLYASDYTYEVVNRTFPGFLQFSGDDLVGGSCTGGSYAAKGVYDDELARMLPFAPAGGAEFQDLFTRIQQTHALTGPGREGQPTLLTPKSWVNFTPTASAPQFQPAATSIPYGCGQAVFSVFPSTALHGDAAIPQGDVVAALLFLLNDGCASPAGPPATACGTSTAECVPDQQNTAACGYCGTLTDVCGADCLWRRGECSDQQTASERCMAGALELRNAGCATTAEVREWSCRAGAPSDPLRCTWQLQPNEICAAPTLEVGASGSTTSLRIPTQQQRKIAVPIGYVCPAVHSALQWGEFVEVHNPSPNEISVQLRVPRDQYDRMLALYTTRPTDADARNCQTISRTCDSAEFDACLTDVVIPAGASVHALVANESPGTATSFELQVVRP